MPSQVVNYQEADPTHVATRLREARDDLGLTRKQAADATGIPAKTIERIEFGQAEPSISRAKILCRYYGLSLTDMIDGMDTTGPKGGRPAAPADMPARRDFGAMPADLDDDDEEQSPEQMAAQALQSLTEFAEERGPNAQGMRRRLREASSAVQGAALGTLTDLAEERDFDEASLPQMARNGAAEKLANRLLIHAIYDLDLHQLSLKGMKALNDDLSDDMLEGVIPGPGLFGDKEAWRIEAAEELAPIVLDAVRKRSAPDLTDPRRYKPRSEDLAQAV